MVSLEKLSMIGTSGFTLSTEEKSALSVAVLSRKQSEGFKDSLKFWGRVTGRDGDYLVAVAYTPAYPFPTKKLFYCATMKPEAVLAQMPDLTDEYATLAAGLVSQPFQGDPSLVIEIPGKEDESPPEPVDGEEPVEPERFREHHRLAFAVSLIERDVAIIPRGAYLVDASHQVVENKGYAGLTYEAAGSLRSYYHMRPPTSARAQAALEKPGIVRATDFLDPIAADKPEGAWSLAFDPSHTTAILRSFYWPGYFFFATVGTGDYGGVYVGNGQPNVDIQFML